MENKFNLSNCAFVVSSTDSYEDIWDGFFSQLRVHFSSFNGPVYLSNETKVYSRDDIEIRQVGLSNPIPATWSQNLLRTLKGISEDYILLLLDDFWLNKPTNEMSLESCLKIIQENEDVGYICLNTNQPGPNISCEFSNLLERGTQANYRINLQAGLWNKKYLLSILRRHENPWMFEWQGTRRSVWYSSKRLFVYEDDSTKPFSYPAGGVLFRGAYIKDYTHFFDASLYKGNRSFKSLKYLRSIHNGRGTNKFNIVYMWKVFKSLLPRIV